jgi:hypothetical protein
MYIWPDRSISEKEVLLRFYESVFQLVKPTATNALYRSTDSLLESTNNKNARWLEKYDSQRQYRKVAPVFPLSL